VGLNLEENGKQCSPVCDFFQCGQRKLIGKKGSGTPSETVCGWVGDPCEGSKCAYGMCFKGKLRPNGSCGLLERTVPKSSIASPRAEPRAENLRVSLLTVAKPKVLKKIKSFDIEGETR
jgi:hypothetical protein